MCREFLPVRTAPSREEPCRALGTKMTGSVCCVDGTDAYGCERGLRIDLVGFPAAIGLIHDPSRPSQASLGVQHRAVSDAD